MAAPPKPSLVKTWAVFGAASVLLLLVAVMTGQGMGDQVAQWQSVTRWFLGLMFGALGVTFAVQLVHCTALSSFWPSLFALLLVAVTASLSFLAEFNWGVGLAIGLIAIAVMGYKVLNGRGD